MQKNYKQKIKKILPRNWTCERCCAFPAG